MRKMLCLLLAFILCLSLCACGETEKPDGDSTTGDMTPDEGTNETKGEAMVLRDEENGYSFINQARFHELVEEVELTTENWLDYLEVYSYTEEKVEKDAFGEIVSTDTSTYYTLGAKNNRYYHLRRFVIEWKDKATGELEIHEGEIVEKENFDLEQYECTRIKGTLYLIDIPEEVEIKKVENMGRYFTVRYSDIGYGPPIDCFIRGIDGRSIGSMIDMILY